MGTLINFIEESFYVLLINVIVEYFKCSLINIIEESFYVYVD